MSSESPRGGGDLKSVISSARHLTELVRRYMSNNSEVGRLEIRVGPGAPKGDPKTSANGPTVVCIIVINGDTQADAEKHATEIGEAAKAMGGSAVCTSTGATQVTCELVPN